ncbi:MAG: branched-chain amino acid ABC transporter permease [Chloroflexi bacterium]|nr:MAG: branched-chain amino acid ABC transporter permease [Chloroflexota bacterium]
MNLDLLVSALVLGSIYALITVGYVVVFRASGIFNFLHPDLMLIGALTYTTFAGTDNGVGFSVAVVVSVLAVSVLGGLIYVASVDRTSGMPHWIQMILTMGLSIAAVNAAQLVWGGNLRHLTLPYPNTTVDLPGVRTTTTDLIIVVVSVVLCTFLYWLLTRSSFAIGFRAAAENPVLAAYHGIQLRRWYGGAWALASGAAVVAGLAYSSKVPLDPSLVNVGLLAFPAALLGGMDSISGAFIGALVLALVQQVAAVQFGTQSAVPLSYAVALVVLMLRPQGLFGQRVLTRV